jgi:translation initiation factor IF-3
MGSTTPNPKKRSYLLPLGCKDLIDILQGVPPKATLSSVRVNGKICAPQVRVIGEQGQQLGIMPLADALHLARSAGIYLVEIAPNAKPPICRLVDYGALRYELSKKGKKK